MEQSDLLQDIEAFLAERGMSPTTFGVKAFRDPMFVFRLREGRDPKLGTALKAIRFMEAERATQ